jgi:multidrug efflux pump subunit AcrB
MTAFWSFFIRRKQFSALVIVALVIASIYALIDIPKESAPEVKIPFAIVSTVLPGASAFDVERLVTDTIEDGLLGSLEGVREITSSSQNSVSSVVVEFDASVELSAALQDLREAVDRVKGNLPDSAEDPRVIQIDFQNQPILTFAIAADRPESELLRLANELERDLLTVRGVSDISIGGFRDREVQVLVEPAALALHNLQILDIISAIDRNNRSFPVGSIEFDGTAYVVEFAGSFTDTAELDEATVTTQTGTVLYLRDVATIIDGFAAETTRSRISVEGAPTETALTFNVTKATNADITSVTRAVNARLDALQADNELLEGVTVLRVLDTGEFLLRDLRELSITGMQAIALVMLVLLITLGWREALIAGTAIPLSFMIGFIGLWASGNTINFLSLFSLILSIGILVDSAIVVVEGIHTRLKANPDGDKEEAAVETISAFNLAITAGTMTTVAVFAPLFFLSGITGEFIKSIPFTLIAVLFASLVVALGIVPLFASLFLRRRSTSSMEERQEVFTVRIQDAYRARLATLIGNRTRERIFVWSVVAVFFVTLLFPVIGFVKVEFFPVGDEDFLIVEIELPDGSVLSETDLVLRSVEEILYDVPFVESFTTTAGAGSAFTGDLSGGGSGSNVASAFLLLESDRTETASVIAQDIRERLGDIRGAEVRVTLPDGGPPVGTPIVVTLAGDSLPELRTAAEQVETLLYDIEGTTAITSSLRAGNPQFTLAIDRAKAATFGLDPGLIGQTLRTAVQGSTASIIRGDGNEIDIIVKLNHAGTTDPHATNQLTVDQLTALELRGTQGLVPLSSVLSTELADGVATIRHENGVRIASVASSVEAGANVREITSEFNRRVASEVSLPAGVTLSLGGEDEEVAQTFTEMGIAAVAGLILMFMILVLQFNSFRHAIYVLSVAPLSLTGIFLGLAITGQPLSFPSLLGFIALAGIVVNNSILLITVINELRRQDPARDINEVILDGATSRLRPILLTTITTVIGVIPLMFVSPLWAPLALALIFGLSFAVVITLALIPILYSRKPGKVS